MVRACAEAKLAGDGRRVGASALLGLTIAALALLACEGATQAAFAAPAPAPPARAASTLKATDTARLHYVSASGSLLYEEGHATGTLPASMRVRFNVGATLSGSFTIYARGGTIVGHGSARLHGEGVYESFSGTLIATGGSERYAHARGNAQMYGTFDRNNYALVIQTVGTLHY